MKCRLLYVVGQLGSGGSERQLYYLLKSIDRERYRPAVVVWSFCEDDAYVARIRQLGIPLHSFRSNLSATAKLYALRQLVSRITPEIIHSYSFYTNFATWWAAMGTHSIAIGSMRSDFEYDRKACGFALGKLSSRWPGTQIYNSMLAAERARSDRGCFLPPRVFFVRNGIDLDEFRHDPLKVNGKVQIIGVGSMLRAKRWDRLLATAANLHKRGFEFHVEICGDGPLRAALMQQAQTLGLSERVRFVGQRSDIPKSLAEATFLAHCADSEGCPNVVMEAMACGRAVVATDAGDTQLLIDDGRTGFVVRRDDPEAFADRMARLIKDRDLCSRLGQAGRAKAEREFSTNRLIEETLAVYRAAGWNSTRV
jgi:glycosyltransferase involved in cell wall biosynthesis